LQKLLDENLAQTLLKLSKPLNVTLKAFSKRLHAIERFIRKKYDYHMGCQKMLLYRMSIATSLQAKKKEFFVAHRDWR